MRILHIYPNCGHICKCLNCGFFVYSSVGHIAIIQSTIICNYPNCGHNNNILIGIGADDDAIGGKGCGREGVGVGAVGGLGIAAGGAATFPV